MTREPLEHPKQAEPAIGGALAPSLTFPKTARILRTAEYRAVYDNGFRVSNRLFAAFCLFQPEGSGARIGVTTPRALGGAVVRNRIKRRLREIFRKHRHEIVTSWEFVINPRKPALDASFEEIELALMSVITKCVSGNLKRS